MSRFPRSSLFYFALVVVLGLVFWFVYQSLQGNQNQNDWSYSALVNNIQDGKVKTVEVKGTDAVATDTGNNKHNVTVPDCSGGGVCWATSLAGQADIKFDTNSSGTYVGPLLRVGTYDVSVRAVGYTPADRKGVVVRLGDSVDPTGDIRGVARLVKEVIATTGH